MKRPLWHYTARIGPRRLPAESEAAGGRREGLPDVLAAGVRTLGIELYAYCFTEGTCDLLLSAGEEKASSFSHWLGWSLAGERHTRRDRRGLCLRSRRPRRH